MVEEPVLARAIVRQSAEILEVIVRRLALPARDAPSFKTYLLALAEAIRGNRTTYVALMQCAARHGEQRSRSGHDMRALLEEFNVIRHAVASVAPRPIVSVAELERLHRLFHASLIEAAVRHDALARRARLANSCAGPVNASLPR